MLVLANIAGLALAWRTQPMSRAALLACQVTLEGGASARCAARSGPTNNTVICCSTQPSLAIHGLSRSPKPKAADYWQGWRSKRANRFPSNPS